MPALQQNSVTTAGDSLGVLCGSWRMHTTKLQRLSRKMKEMFYMAQGTQHIQFSWSRACPVCVHRARVSLTALAPSCHHLSQGEMPCRASQKPHHQPVSWDIQVGLVCFWWVQDTVQTQSSTSVSNCVMMVPLPLKQGQQRRCKWSLCFNPLKSLHRVWILA